MTIEIVTTLKLTCSICGKTVTYTGGSKMEVIKEARNEGWHLLIDATCRDCQPKEQFPEVGR